MKSPDRTPLSEKTADSIEQAIRNGRWKDKLPGYLKLSDMMGVSTRTMLSALAILTHRKVILPAERTKARRVNPELVDQHQLAEKSKTLLILADKPLQELWFANRQVIEKISTLFTNKGWSVHFEATPEIAKNQPGPTMYRLLSNFSDHPWLVMAPSSTIVDWCTRHHLRIICAGGDIGKRQPPLVGARLTDMLDSSIHHLAELGHQRICILKPPTTKEARTFLSNHCAATLKDLGLAYHASYNFPALRSHTSTSVLRTLDKLFTHTSPTALITTDFAQLLTIYSYCRQNNLCIPEDISVICTQQSQFLPWIHPLPVHFTLPVSQYVSKLQRWIEHYPVKTITPVYVTPKFHAGESTGAPHPKLLI